MKRSQLQALIREALDEVLNEGNTYAGKDATDDMTKDPKYGSLSSIGKTDAINRLRQGGTVTIGEIELDELANVAIRYQLAPDVTAADFPGKKGRIITAMQAAGEPMSKMDVAAEMGYNKQNPINADFMALVASGAIVPAGQQAAPRFSRPQPEPVAAPVGGDEEGDEEGPAGYEDPEGGIAGEMSDEEIDASFAKALSGDEDEEEIEDIEVDAAPTASMSDDDYEAFMQYTDLETRLAKIKSDLNREKRGARMGGDDISGGRGVDLENLRALKSRLQQKIDDLVASSPYLQSRIAKTSEPKELDEWTKNKLKYYAGIIK